MKCSVVECTIPAHGRGYCRSHYMRWWRYGNPLILGNRKKPNLKLRRPFEGRFWARVEQSPDSDCLIWMGAATLGNKGFNYGEFWYEGKRVSTHRAVYNYYVEPIPMGYVVCHACDTPLCVNPGHLFMGTQADNLHDMWNKNRGNEIGLVKGWYRKQPETLKRYLEQP